MNLNFEDLANRKIDPKCSASARVLLPSQRAETFQVRLPINRNSITMNLIPDNHIHAADVFEGPDYSYVDNNFRDQDQPIKMSDEQEKMYMMMKRGMQKE